jgi:hypothetical protein
MHSIHTLSSARERSADQAGVENGVLFMHLDRGGPYPRFLDNSSYGSAPDTADTGAQKPRANSQPSILRGCSHMI